MRLYKETLRKLSPVGIPLAVATLLYTFITGGQECFGNYYLSTSTSAIGVTPVLVYYVFTAALFALYGFSFLFRRPASDLYHSLPVKRLDIYFSITLATATWMGATIVLNVLSMLGMLLISGCPFVPAYIPLSIVFYFVASMLVFAATAIGCSLSGTYITAMASTGIVLFLPRFVQFIIARGLVDKVTIVGWMDLGALLNPVTNAATGLVVMQTRNMFVYNIISAPNILYTFALMAVELALGALLFYRRPSETADHGAINRGWAIATACLLAFTVMLLITVDSQKLFSVYGAAMISVSLLVFVLYAFVSLRDVKRVLKALPFFLLSGALAFCVSLGIDSVKANALAFTPAPDEIATVSFRGHDSVQGDNEYASTLLKDIHFTNDDLKKYVSDNLSAAVEKIIALQNEDNYDEYGFYTSGDPYNPNQVIEPVTVRLNSGKTVMRTISFSNVNTLNELRSENEEYQTVIHAFPPANSIQYLNLYNSDLTKDEVQQIWESLKSEMTAKGLVPNDYYQPRISSDDEGYAYTRGGDQSLLTINTAGYTGTQRFSDYYRIQISTPDTASLLMRTMNQYAKADTLTRFADSVKHMASPLALENDYISLTADFFNVPLDNGEPLSTSFSVYISGYTKKNEVRYADLYLKYAQELSDILKRATPTDNAEGMFLRLDWYQFDSANRVSNNQSEPNVFLSFTPEDEAALVTLLQNWQTDTMYGY